MEVFSGNACTVPINVIIAGVHVDTDGDLVTAELTSHPGNVPAVSRLGLGRYLLTFTNLSPSLSAGQITECVVTVTVNAVQYTPFGIPISVSGSQAVTLPPAPPVIGDGTVGALTLARTAITNLIAEIDAIPNGDQYLPEVLEFTVGRKQVSFTGPLRKAQALVMLSEELRTLQDQLNAATQAASRGSSFVRLAVK